MTDVCDYRLWLRLYYLIITASGYLSRCGFASQRLNGSALGEGVDWISLNIIALLMQHKSLGSGTPSVKGGQENNTNIEMPNDYGRDTALSLPNATGGLETHPLLTGYCAWQGVNQVWL